MHEQPFISNVADRSSHEILQENQLICLEPIVTDGDGTYTVAADKWTINSKGIVAQFEHTIKVGIQPDPLTAWEPEFFKRVFGFDR